MKLRRFGLNQGDIYGKLTFVENIKMECNGKMYSTGLGKFVCECGNEYIGNILSVRNGNTKSCGCLLKEKSLKVARDVNIKYGTNIGKIKSNKPTKRSKTGIVGVHWNNGKKLWEASISFQGKQYKKRTKNFEDAVTWRKEMEEKLFTPFLKCINE